MKSLSAPTNNTNTSAWDAAAELRLRGTKATIRVLESILGRVSRIFPRVTGHKQQGTNAGRGGPPKERRRGVLDILCLAGVSKAST